MRKKLFKYFVCISTALSLFVSVTSVGVFAYNNSGCSKCRMIQSDVSSSYVDEDGNIVKIFEDGVEAIYFANGEIILKDYFNVYNADLNQPGVSTRAIAWIKIGQAIFNSIGGCSMIPYLTGFDICRIVISKLGTSVKPSAKYELTGKFIPGYIPGCEPRHSGPCNAGYWEYKIVPL